LTEYENAYVISERCESTAYRVEYETEEATRGISRSNLCGKIGQTSKSFVVMKSYDGEADQRIASPTRRLFVIAPQRPFRRPEPMILPLSIEKKTSLSHVVARF